VLKPAVHISKHSWNILLFRTIWS